MKKGLKLTKKEIRDSAPYEKDFQTKFLKHLDAIPNSYFKKISDRSQSGIPDILGCICGVFIAIELKTKTDTTAIQVENLRQIDKAGGQSFVVNPDNALETLRFLAKIALLQGKVPLKRV